jgi:hypothetical protein
MPATYRELKTVDISYAISRQYEFFVTKAIYVLARRANQTEKGKALFGP